MRAAFPDLHASPQTVPEIAWLEVPAANASG
jgi:hypothetical protein